MEIKQYTNLNEKDKIKVKKNIKGKGSPYLIQGFIHPISKYLFIIK